MTVATAEQTRGAGRHTLARVRALGRSVFLCVAAVALVDAPPVVAEPPGYSGYAAVDPEPFQTYFTYGGNGVQFTSPSGLMCRIAVISRGSYAYAECFGHLAAAGDANDVRITSTGLATISRSSLPQFLTDQRVSEKGVNTEPISASDFHLLPAGHSLTYSVRNLWSGTCAVDTDTTRCTVTSNAQSGSTTKDFTLTPAETSTW